MNEQENRQELRRKLIRARDIEEVRAILGPETAEEEIQQTWREIEAHRLAEGLETVDDSELEAVSGGADRDWEKEGCSATAENGSWCGSDDYCVVYDVTYSNFDPCPKGGKHDWKLLSKGKDTGLKGTKRYCRYICQQCKIVKKEYM